MQTETSGVDRVDPGAWTPPSDATLVALLERDWGLTARVEPLPSYTDHNRRVRATTGDYVLKIGHPQWSTTELDFENQALLHLERTAPVARAPRVHANIRGETLVPLPLGDGRTAHARLVDYMPGRLLADVDMSAALARSIGEQVAHLTVGLAGFTHPAARRPMEWNLALLSTLRDEVPHIGDARLATIVSRTLDEFAIRLPGWLLTLPQQVCHNDANDYNLIVDPVIDTRISGIIDFGDMCHTFRICDLAIAAVYAMQLSDDPQATLEHVRLGYEAVNPVTDAERDLLPAFIRARLCQSILMATHTHRSDPDNTYVLVSQRGVRALLQQLA